MILLSFSAWSQTPQQQIYEKLSQALDALEKSAEFQSTESALRALELDFRSRDVVLQPTISLEGKRINESRQTYSQIFKPQVESLSLTLTKPFSTGTEIKFAPIIERVQTATFNPATQNTFDWQLSISQSLWQNGFGESTRLRWGRERFERQQKLAEILRSRAQIYYDFEQIYWDWALALREVELRAKNVQRGQDILRWVKDRYRRAAAESTDLLQAQALLSQRQLQAASAQQMVNSFSARARRYVAKSEWQPDANELLLARSVEPLVVDWPEGVLPEPRRLELLEAENAAMVADFRAKEARESIRPALDLSLVYGKNAIDPNIDMAVRKNSDESHEFSSVAVVFKSGLDLNMERQKVESARAISQGAQQKQEALENDAQIAWKQMERELDDLASRIRHAKILVENQMQKAAAERERYRKGRSTAFQSIAFEQEAAEAEIALWTLYGLMRKTEARARLFAR